MVDDAPVMYLAMVHGVSGTLDDRGLCCSSDDICLTRR